MATSASSEGLFLGSITNGILMEVRDLQTKDKSRVWRTIFKVGFIGGVAECTADDITNKSDFKAGTVVNVSGNWCDGGMNKQHFLINTIDVVKA